MSSICGICGEDTSFRVILNASESECGTTLNQLLWLLSPQIATGFPDLDKICAICLEKAKMISETIINIRKKFMVTQLLLKSYQEVSETISWSEFKNNSTVEELPNNIVSLKLKEIKIDSTTEIKNNENINLNNAPLDDDYTNLEWLTDDLAQNRADIPQGKPTAVEEVTESHSPLVKKKKKKSLQRTQNRITKRGYAYTTLSGEYVIKKADGVYLCKICKTTFKYPSRAECHVRSVHIQEKPFECNTCRKTFSASHILQRHISCVHKEAKYICEKCGLEFNRPYVLLAHEKSHLGPPSFCCTHSGCSKFFYSELLLKRHTKHHEEKKIVCDKCGALFRNNSRLAEHVKRKHKI